MSNGKISLFSTKLLSKTAIDEIKQAIQGLDYGSVEIHVVNSEITQISKRMIKKTAAPNYTIASGTSLKKT